MKMNPVKDIKEAQAIIKALKEKIPMIRDQIRMDRHIQLINLIIRLINDVEWLLEEKFQTSTIEKLILARFYSQIFPLYRPEDKIDIHQIVRNIDEDLRYPKELLMEKILTILQGKEMDLIIQQEDPDLTQLTPASKHRDMIEDLLLQFKAQIQWKS